MALIEVGDVVQSVAALMDDPSQSAFDKDYVLPFLNLRWANLVVNLAMLGIQYSQETAIFTIPAGTVDLSNFMLPGGPLASLMSPIGIDWKPVGAPDTEYDPADSVRKIDDLPAGKIGIQEYAWIGGTITVTPSSEDVTARVTFQAMSTNLIDPTDNMIRGVGDIIAFRTAEIIWGIRGNRVLKQDMKDYGDTALEDFITLSVMTDQTNLYELPPTHPRNRGALALPMAAPNQS